ncbi:hypothetical protein GQ55_8G150200 [Panicum hallii var. hallii]|uniref:Uncharacterized protein n=1 Tax=Panicum hallii var. hallii TaxID=1504633 RepID=A0A2T7CN53_9POAL|nr:hypothetical protein GQ55_8G150200 [Panicum hallii var. hallii]
MRRIHAQVLLHRPAATTSYFQFYFGCLLAALATVVWDTRCEGFIYVHLRYGAHGSLIQIYSPSVKRCNIVQRFDRLKYCFLAYFENDWTQHLCC